MHAWKAIQKVLDHVADNLAQSRSPNETGLSGKASVDQERFGKTAGISKPVRFGTAFINKSAFFPAVCPPEKYTGITTDLTRMEIWILPVPLTKQESRCAYAMECAL